MDFKSMVNHDEYSAIRVNIFPAKNNISVNDANIIEEAILNANLNLFQRHKSWIEPDYADLYCSVIAITLYRPKNNKDTVTQSLSGIARYIRKKHPDFSKNHSQQNRLFYYTVFESEEVMK